MYTQINKLSQFIGQEVTLRGWLNNKRSSGSIAFLELRDGSGFVQCVASKKEVSEDVWNEVEKLTQESSLEVTGKVSKHPKLDNVFELQVSKLTCLQVANDYPISKKEHGPEFLMDNRHLWLRSKKQWAIMKIRDEVFFSLMNFLREENFTRVDAPILQPTSCEDTSELFAIDFFGEKSYLTQSGQLYIEAAEMSLGRVYDFGPVFRAEKSKTRKHLNEFWMMDAELPNENLEQMLEFIEKLIKRLLKDILEHCRLELEILERDTQPLQKLLAKKFAVFTHEQVINLLNERFAMKLGPLDDIGAPEEEKLAELFDVPVFVTDWPAEIKAFYMVHFDDHGRERVKAVDLICSEGYGEIVGGSEREWNYDKLLRVMKRRHYSVEDYQWYLDLRKYGSIPHSGFGIGLERVIRWLGGVHHIRECIPFPRMINRLRP